jgi:hypothetical protein
MNCTFSPKVAPGLTKNGDAPTPAQSSMETAQSTPANETPGALALTQLGEAAAVG